jgi:hypothetical protein
VRWFGVCVGLAACSAYNGDLLKLHAASRPGGTGGGTGGVRGTSGAGGSQGAGGPNEFPLVDAGPRETRCGDGQVTGDETCDISIESGKAGSCPLDCPPLGTCSPRALNNMGTCKAECVLLMANCVGGDGCCPSQCTNALDSDCSANCGDGVLQSGETCDPKLSSSPCKTLADCDDHDACTLDALTGSAAACNADCMHTRITMLSDGDGCCPTGANANMDMDCKPVCGNGVRENGEDCDGGIGCSSDCKLTLTPEQVRCLTDYAMDDCERCSCTNCIGTNQYLDCRDIDKTNGNDNCNAVLLCARAHNCTGQSCYCGDDPYCGTFTGGPAGPCTAEIEAAAGATDVATVDQQRNQAGTVLNRSYVADQCRVMNCKDTCR